MATSTRRAPVLQGANEAPARKPVAVQVRGAAACLGSEAASAQFFGEAAPGATAARKLARPLGVSAQRQEYISQTFLDDLKGQVEEALLCSCASLRDVAHEPPAQAKFSDRKPRDVNEVKTLDSRSLADSAQIGKATVAANAVANSGNRTISGPESIAEVKRSEPLLRHVAAVRRELLARFGSPGQAFAALDADLSGALSYSDFKGGLERLDIPWKELVDNSAFNLRAVFRALDVDGTGELRLHHLTRGAEPPTGRVGEPDEEPSMVAEGDELLTADGPRPVGHAQAAIARAGALRARQVGTPQAAPLQAEPWRAHQRPATTAQGHALFGPPARVREPTLESQTIRPAEAAKQYERGKELLRKRQAAIKKRAEERLAEEEKELLNKPQISKSSRRLAINHRPNSFARRRQQRLEDAKAKQERECTFKPHMSKGTRQISKTMLSRGGEWHHHLNSPYSNTTLDRMGCKARRDADQHADFSFTPTLSRKARQLSRDGSFQRLSQQGRSRSYEPSSSGAWGALPSQASSPRSPGGSCPPSASLRGEGRPGMLVSAPPEILSLFALHSLDKNEEFRDSEDRDDEFADPGAQLTYC